METNQQFLLLQQKIEEIGTAIFFNDSESVMRLPSSLVANVRVDDYGFIWFYTFKKHKQQNAFESSFPLRLQFFRKGIEHTVNIDGIGWVVTDLEQLEFYQNTYAGLPQGTDEMVLVKVKIASAEYQEKRSAQEVWSWRFIAELFFPKQLHRRWSPEYLVS